MRRTRSFQCVAARTAGVRRRRSTRTGAAHCPTRTPRRPRNPTHRARHTHPCGLVGAATAAARRLPLLQQQHSTDAVACSAPVHPSHSRATQQRSYCRLRGQGHQRQRQASQARARHRCCRRDQHCRSAAAVVGVAAAGRRPARHQTRSAPLLPPHLPRERPSAPAVATVLLAWPLRVPPTCGRGARRRRTSVQCNTVPFRSIRDRTSTRQQVSNTAITPS